MANDEVSKINNTTVEQLESLAAKLSDDELQTWLNANQYARRQVLTAISELNDAIESALADKIEDDESDATDDEVDEDEFEDEGEED